MAVVSETYKTTTKKPVAKKVPGMASMTSRRAPEPPAAPYVRDRGTPPPTSTPAPRPLDAILRGPTPAPTPTYVPDAFQRQQLRGYARTVAPTVAPTPAPTVTPVVTAAPMTVDPYSRPASWFAPTSQASMSIGKPATLGLVTAAAPASPYSTYLPLRTTTAAPPSSLAQAATQGAATGSMMGNAAASDVLAPRLASPPNTGATYAAANSAPGWVDKAWWEQFKQEHGGEDPISFYGGGEDALDRAWADKQWGDQFYRTYNAAPDIYDWKASYYDRKYGNGPYSNNYGYGGGGGGGGGYTGYSYGTNAMSALPATNYFDYNTFAKNWYGKTYHYPTTNEATNFVNLYKLWAQQRGLNVDTTTPEQFNSFMESYLASGKGLDNIAFVNNGII